MLSMSSIFRNQRGSVAVIVALAMVGLLGFAGLAIDVGMLFMTRAQLATKADAAALAGASYLPTGTAVENAQMYADKNTQPGDSVNPTVGSGNTSLTVDVSRAVNMLFARVLGFTTQNVTATATASISSVGGVFGRAGVPLGIEKQDFRYNAIYELRTGSGGGDGQGSGALRGNYRALALGGTGSDNYGKNLQLGYDGTIVANQWVDTEPGAKVGDTKNAIQDRIDRNDRIVIVPVIDPDSLKTVNGRDVIKVVGFASFYVESVDGNGRVFGRFRGNATSSNTIPGNGGNYGLYNIRLTN